MSALIGALRVTLGIDSAAFEEGLNRAQQSMQRVGQRMQSIGTTMSAAITAPLVGIAVKSVSAFQTQEKALAAVEAAVKSTGGAAGLTTEQLAKMASELQSVSTFGDEDILGKVTANLLTFTNVAEENFGRAQLAALDLSARLGTDLQGSAIMLGKALNDPVVGLTALSRVGVSFTEQQKEMIKALAEGGEVAKAQGIILDELGRQYGGQAQALADTIGGQQTQAWNALGDALESVGAIIAQYIPPIAAAIKSAAEAFQALSPATQNFIVVGGALAAALGPIALVLGTVVVALGAFAAPVAAVVAGIVLLTAAVVAFWPEIKAATAAVIEFGTNALDWIKSKPAEIAEAFRALGAQMYQFGIDIIDGLWLGIQEKWEQVKGGIANIPSQIGGFFKSGMGIFSPSRVMHEIGGFIMQGLANGIAAGRPLVQTNLAGATGDVKQPFDDLSQAIGQQFSSMFDGLISGTKSAGEAIKGLLQSLGKLLINKAFNALLGGLFGGGGGGGFLSSLFGGFRASGGPVSGGKAYVVGERGPELMVPGMSGTVIPNNALNDNGGGHVSVSLMLSDDLDARIESTSGRVSAQIVQANNRQIPSIISNSQRRTG